MQVSQDEIVMYARACRAWYGRRASRVAMSQAEHLRRRGDMSGVDAWTKVATEVTRLQSGSDRARRRNAAGRLY
jgi:hypothetical protein